jgi:GT2 family glycosyltransferase
VIYLLTVNYYSTSLILKLIESLPDQQQISYQIVIVNNSPEDRDLKQINNTNVQILEAKTNLGFAAACNLGLNWIYAQDREAIVWPINPDAYLLSGTLAKVPVFFASHPEISLLGTIVYTPDLEIWFGGGRFIPQLGAIFSTDLLSAHPEIDYVSCDWVSGCSFLINLRHFRNCPQFDPAYFLYYEDFDFCQRYLALGHKIFITSQLAVIHQPSSITGRDITNKLKYSTYSYLLTLQRYTNPLIFCLRFLRLLLYASILLIFKPKTGLGKFYGVFSYFKSIVLLIFRSINLMFNVKNIS